MVVGGQTLVAEMKLLKEMQEHSGLFHFPFRNIILTFWLHFNDTHVWCYKFFRGQKDFEFRVMACLCRPSCFITSGWKSCVLLPSGTQWAGEWMNLLFSFVCWTEIVSSFVLVGWSMCVCSLSLNIWTGGGFYQKNSNVADSKLPESSISVAVSSPKCHTSCECCMLVQFTTSCMSPQNLISHSNYHYLQTKFSPFFFLYFMTGRQGDRWNLCSNESAATEFCKIQSLSLF